LETSARLLRLLSLLQSRRDWTGMELASRLGVTARTVRRDVEKLRGLGYPVNAAPGVAGGYRLGAGAALPPLLLDDDEAVAVAIGLRSAAAGTVAGIEESSVRALAKLEQVLPSRLRHRVATLHAASVALTGTGPTVDPEILTAIASACRDHQRLRFDYRGHRGEVTTRTVEPHRLVHTPLRWYLLAWDGDRADWRTFRVDRITTQPSARSRFSPRTPPEDAAAYVARGLTTAPYRYQARILMHAPVVVVAERTSPTATRLEAVDEDSCLLFAGADSLQEIALHVALKGIDFEVLDPPELADQVLELAARLHRAVPGADRSAV
jgi:predicted DNA-binding transcriptional regulator YafY